MSRYNNDDVWAKAKGGDDDDWETDGDYVNNLDEKSQRKAGTVDRLEVPCLFVLVLVVLCFCVFVFLLCFL